MIHDQSLQQRRSGYEEAAGKLTYANPLRLFWYKKEQNFGDAISRTIVSHVSGRDVTRSRHHAREMCPVGLLLKTITINMQDLRYYVRQRAD